MGLIACVRALTPLQTDDSGLQLTSSSHAQPFSNPFGSTKHAMSYRLLRDAAACSISVRVVNGEEQITCSQSMEDLFVSSQELHSMRRQFGVLSGYLWCIFVVPEDRSRLIIALSSAAYERGARIQLDTVVRCVSRRGDVIRCLASTGFHAEEGEGAQMVSRLWPLAHRDLNVLVRKEVGRGGGGGRDVRVEEGGRGGGGGGGMVYERAIPPGPARLEPAPAQDVAAWLEVNPVLASSASCSIPPPHEQQQHLHQHQHHQHQQDHQQHQHQHQHQQQSSTEANPPHPHPYQHSTEPMTVVAASALGEEAADIPPLSTDMWDFVVEATACSSPAFFSQEHGGSSM